MLESKLWVLEKMLSQVLTEQFRQKFGTFMGNEMHQGGKRKTVNTSKKLIRDIKMSQRNM